MIYIKAISIVFNFKKKVNVKNFRNFVLVNEKKKTVEIKK